MADARGSASSATRSRAIASRSRLPRELPGARSSPPVVARSTGSVARTSDPSAPAWTPPSRKRRRAWRARADQSREPEPSRACQRTRPVTSWTVRRACATRPARRPTGVAAKSNSSQCSTSRVQGTATLRTNGGNGTLSRGDGVFSSQSPSTIDLHPLIDDTASGIALHGPARARRR